MASSRLDIIIQTAVEGLDNLSKLAGKLKETVSNASLFGKSTGDAANNLKGLDAGV